MPNYEPPPTYADPVIVDEVTRKSRFNPVWLKWFLDLATILGNLGADLDGIDHNSLGSIQGGSASERFHLTSVQATDLTDAGDSAAHFHSADRNSANFTGTNWTDLTDAGDSTLHFHAADRARANHTGTQAFSTISDAAATVYTPTRSAEANLDANVTLSEAQYLRAGSTVMVSGRFTADPTLTATATSFEMSLPVASNLGAAEDLAGTAVCGNIASMCAEVAGSVANNTAVVSWRSTDITSQSWSYIYLYQVI